MAKLSLVHHRQRKVSIIALTILLFAFLAFVAPVWSGPGTHNIPGTACAAYNNNQANALERSHVRLYNPPSNPNSVWVICPAQRVVEDINSTTGNVYGWVNSYFSSLSPASAEVLCIIREFSYSTIHEPGGTLAGMLNSETVTATRPLFPPSFSVAYWDLTTDYTGSFNYWTITCRLAPGTGINSIDVYQR